MEYKYMTLKKNKNMRTLRVVKKMTNLNTSEIRILIEYSSTKKENVLLMKSIFGFINLFFSRV